MHKARTMGGYMVIPTAATLDMIDDPRARVRAYADAVRAADEFLAGLNTGLDGTVAELRDRRTKWRVIERLTRIPMQTLSNRIRRGQDRTDLHAVDEAA